MWNKLKDPIKQLKVGNKIKEIVNEIEEVYNVYEVEYDQFKIELLTKNNVPVKDKIQITMTPEQILKYEFLIEKIL